MYKKQLTVQKLLCLAAIIMSAVVFIYSLGIMTDLYDSLYSTMRNPKDHTQTSVPGSIVYYNMQSFNQLFVKYAIVLILLGALLFLTNTNVRRRYYVGNFVSVALYVIFSIYMSITCHQYIEVFKAKWQAIDFAALAEHADTWDTLYTESTFWFDIHYVVFGLLLLVCVGLVLNVVWKLNLQKEEKKLTDAGKGAKA